MKNETPSPHDLLLAHLLDPPTEEERQRLELAALEDDEFFDQLRAAETELVDRYVGGELGEGQAVQLAELVGRSRRLQESAETTLALKTRQQPSQPTAGESDERGSEQPSKTVSNKPGSRVSTGKIFWVITGLLWVVLAALLWQVHQEQGLLRDQLVELEAQQESLEANLQELNNELEALREEQLRHQRRRAEQQIAVPGSSQ